MSIKYITAAILVASFGFGSTAPVYAANNDLFGSIIGGMIGSAILNGTQQRKRRVYHSSPARQENKRIQTSLNYFGFPAGSPDGVLGRRSRGAIAAYQSFLGYSATGVLNDFEKGFLMESYNRAIAGGYSTTQQISSNPMGPKGLLITYRSEMAAATRPPIVPRAAIAVFTPITIAPQPQPDAAKSSAEIAKLQKSFDDLGEQITLLTVVLAYVRTIPDGAEKVAKLSAIELRLKKFKQEQGGLEQAADAKYSTPIRPKNGDAGVTALKVSEVFPRVPYYVPGTKEFGEMWVAPKVTDKGALVYNFNFMDPTANYATLRDSIEMTPANVVDVSRSFSKVNDWTILAKNKGLHKSFSKRVSCFPLEACGPKKVGNTSTEVDFVLYEDGSTAAKVLRNKGLFSTGYNFSVQSAMLLSAYLDFMKNVGEKEFNAGTMTNEELNSVFQ